MAPALHQAYLGAMDRGAASYYVNSRRGREGAPSPASESEVRQDLVAEAFGLVEVDPVAGVRHGDVAG